MPWKDKGIKREYMLINQNLSPKYVIMKKLTIARVLNLMFKQS